MLATETTKRHVTHKNHQNKKRLEGQDKGSNPWKMKCWSPLLMSACFFFREVRWYFISKKTFKRTDQMGIFSKQYMWRIKGGHGALKVFLTHRFYF